MDTIEQANFDELYSRHLRALKSQGMSEATIDSYARAVRRVATHFDCSPERLSTEQLEVYFAGLEDSHSWSTVKIDRNGLQFSCNTYLKRIGNGLKSSKYPKCRHCQIFWRFPR